MDAVDTLRIENPSSLAERLRAQTCGQLEQVSRSKLGQFLTVPPVARMLSDMFGPFPSEIRLLDAGAGLGALTAAFVREVVSRPKKPEKLHLAAVEIEQEFLTDLERVLQAAVALAESHGIKASYELIREDFLALGKERLNPDLLAISKPRPSFTHAILNPPYAKITSQSPQRLLIRKCGLESSNLYTGFLWVTANLMAPNGELVAITPRSFCNGPYFLTFRKQFLALMAMEHILVFDQRNMLFAGDSVLQENIIFRARRTDCHPDVVQLSAANGAGEVVSRQAAYADVIHPGDPQMFIHLALNERSGARKQAAGNDGRSLGELGLQVSTGRVVDFRATEWLCKDPEPGVVPLIYPQHLSRGWPIAGFKKHNAFKVTSQGRIQLVANGIYVLIKRFTAKEEKRRVVAFVYRPIEGYELVGFENHLNYFHREGGPLELEVAEGLAAFLNSEFVDTYFRQFSGHTQVNATDLRSLRYPSEAQLRELAHCRDVEASIERMLMAQTQP